MPPRSPGAFGGSGEAVGKGGGGGVSGGRASVITGGAISGGSAITGGSASTGGGITGGATGDGACAEGALAEAVHWSSAVLHERSSIAHKSDLQYAPVGHAPAICHQCDASTASEEACM